MLAPVDTQQLPVPERRSGASRQRLTMRAAKLRCGSGDHPCVMLDISHSGTRLRLFAGHPPDTHMFLYLANGEFYAVERRWISGEEAGFRFSCVVDVDEFVREAHSRGRRPLRIDTEHQVELAVAGELSHAVMVNLSARGACIEAGRQVVVGTLLKVGIAGRPARYARVCWRKNYRHGLAFEDELPFADFARLAADLHPFDPVIAHAQSDVAVQLTA